MISRGYNLLLRGALRARFSDAQCGFKAIRADVAREVLPLVEDNAWFFDTELLVLAERAGLRIHEVPVDWVDDPDSRVDIVRTALDDVRGIVRLGRGLVCRPAPGRRGRRAARPGVSADAGGGRLGHAGGDVRAGRRRLDARVRRALPAAARLGLGAQPANLLALLVTAVANTAANRRLTFGVRGRRRRAAPPGAGAGRLRGRARRHQRRRCGCCTRAGRPSHGVEVVVLTVANLSVTVMRFVAMRAWVFARRRVARAGQLTRTVRSRTSPGPDRSTRPAHQPQRLVAGRVGAEDQEEEAVRALLQRQQVAGAVDDLPAAEPEPAAAEPHRELGARPAPTSCWPGWGSWTTWTGGGCGSGAVMTRHDGAPRRSSGLPDARGAPRRA